MDRLNDSAGTWARTGVMTPRTVEGIVSGKEHVHTNDEDCSFCEEKAIVVIQGPGNCYYCGHQINLCKKHLPEVLCDLEQIKRDWGLLDAKAVL